MVNGFPTRRFCGHRTACSSVEDMYSRSYAYVPICGFQHLSGNGFEDSIDWEDIGFGKPSDPGKNVATKFVVYYYLGTGISINYCSQ